MADFPFNIVGFDLDGTLFDTSGDLANALNRTLATIGRPPFAVAQVKPMIGRGIRHMLERGLAASPRTPTSPGTPASGATEELDRLFPILLDFYESDIARETHLFPGALEALDALAARGVKLAIVSNKLERLAVKIVAELGLTSRFACVLGGDSTPEPKPSPRPIGEMLHRCGGGSAAFVGDSIFDTQAARAAGLPSIAVSFGFLNQPVAELGADRVIDHFDELLPALEQLGQRPAGSSCKADAH